MSARVTVDLSRVRRNAADVVDRTGVPLLAVVKADAYGLGAGPVADALSDLGDRLAGFYVFDAVEAVNADLYRRTSRRTVALHGMSLDPGDYLSLHIQPAVWDVDRARALRPARPVLSLDTGQQRFACRPTEAMDVRLAGDCQEVMTHATRPDQADKLQRFVVEAGWHPRPLMHAAATALLEVPTARFDAVRPGLALYHGAVRVSAPLIEARNAVGPAGYTGFCVQRFGVIRVGYRDGLKPGPCRVGGRPSRVLEVGMQTAFVEVGPDERVGDPVVLLGHDTDGDNNDDLSAVTESALAAAWGVSPQEVLVRLTAAGPRSYR